MKQVEELQRILEVYKKAASHSENIPQDLDDYLKHVVRTGDTIFEWPEIKFLYSEKLKQAIKLSKEHSIPLSDIPKHKNIQPLCLKSMESMLISRLDFFDDPPFTIQRLTELLLSPCKEYNRHDRYLRALEKNLMVANMQIGQPPSPPLLEIDFEEEERRRLVAEILATQMFCQTLADGNKRKSAEVEEPTAKKAKFGEMINKMTCEQKADKSKVFKLDHISNDVVGAKSIKIHPSPKRYEYTTLLKRASEEYSRKKECRDNQTVKTTVQEESNRQDVTAGEINVQIEPQEKLVKSLNKLKESAKEEKESANEIEISDARADESVNKAGESYKETKEPVIQATEYDTKTENYYKQDPPTAQAKEHDNKAGTIAEEKKFDKNDKKAIESDTQAGNTNERSEKCVNQAEQPNKEEFAVQIENSFKIQEVPTVEDVLVKEIQKLDQEQNTELEGSLTELNLSDTIDSNASISLPLNKSVLGVKSEVNQEDSVSADSTLSSRPTVEEIKVTNVT